MDIISYLSDNFNIQFNEQQKQGVLSVDKNALLLAVPGSGKTTVLVSRIAHLMLNCNVHYSKILTLTYSKETAKDMRKRFEVLFGEQISSLPSFSTIHSFCLSVMRYYSKQLSRQMPELINTKSGLKQRVLREIYKHYNDEFLTDDTYDIVEQLIGYAKNTLLAPTYFEDKNVEVSNFDKIFTDYEKYKKENHLFDFDDMLTVTLDILTKFDGICDYFRDKYSYINVDEAQDTSLVQHKIVQALSKRSIVFMVGDEDQSIYSFRGAYPKALLEFNDNYDNSVVMRMEQNFRSNSDIVKRANQFIKQNKQRYSKEMYCDNQNENSIKIINLKDYSMQAMETLKLIKNCPPDKTIAVVYKNNESAISLINLLYENNMEFYIKEHKITYFTSMVMRDIAAYMRIAMNTSDVDAFSQIYYKLGYSKGVYEFVQNNIVACDDIFETILMVPSLTDYRRQQTKWFMRAFPRLLRKSPQKAISFIQSDINYDSYIERRMQDGFTKTNTYQKINTAKELAGGLKTIEEFLDRVDELSSAMSDGKNINKNSNITLTTLHSSKGLEFDKVIMLDIIKDIIPSSDTVDEMKKGKSDPFENEVRLFYVGVTRAKSELIIYKSHSINGLIAAPSDFTNLLMLDNYKNEKGTLVEHNLYGRGRITYKQGDIIKVDFDRFGEKSFSYEICVKYQIMREIKEESVNV